MRQRGATARIPESKPCMVHFLWPTVGTGPGISKRWPQAGSWDCWLLPMDPKAPLLRVWGVFSSLAAPRCLQGPLAPPQSFQPCPQWPCSGRPGFATCDPRVGARSPIRWEWQRTALSWAHTPMPLSRFTSQAGPRSAHIFHFLSLSAVLPVGLLSNWRAQGLRGDSATRCATVAAPAAVP